MKRVRVLVTDDSHFMRAAIRKVLAAEPRIEVVGEARDGQEAVTRVAELGPDVVTMDLNMPVLDGTEAVRAIMRTRPTPVVMLSAHTTAGAQETMAALEAGAVDFLAKPSGEVSARIAVIGAQLVAKVLAAAEARVLPVRAPLPSIGPRSTGTGRLAPPASATTPRLTRVVIVAVSTGGPAALGRLLPRLDPHAPLALVVVQHMPSGFTASLAERLASLSALQVREAREGDHPEAGVALIAPGDRHLEFAADGTVQLDDGPEVNGVRPAADVTMRSAARVWGRRSVGVIMTGMGRDGAEGLAAIKRAGGHTLAQDQASSVIWGMPRAAIDAGAVDEVVPLDELASVLERL